MNPNQLLIKILLIFTCCAEFSFAQDISISKISDDSGIQTDRRPISIGFYDGGANKTFISWMGSYSSAVVKEYDHTAKIWSDDKTVGISPFADSHNYPAMVQAPDGKLIVFYGCHNTVMRITSSPHASSIEGGWNDRNLE